MDGGFAKRFGHQTIQRPALVEEYLTATELTQDWANLTGWTVTGVQVSGNRLYGVAGGNPAACGIAFAVAAGECMKITAEIVVQSTNSGTQYIGVNFGGTNNGVNASLPNFAGIGIGSANRYPARFVGTGFSTVTTGNVFLQSTTSLTGTWRANVTVDEDSISLVLQSQDGATEYSETIPRSYAPNSGAVTSIILWNGSTNGTSGHYFKAMGAKKSITPFRTKTNAAGTIEGNTPLVIQRNGGDPWRIQLPSVMDGMKRTPLAVFFHQSSTGTKDSVITEARWSALRVALNNSGFAILSANDGGDRWGNPDSVANYAALVDWVLSKVHSGKIFLIGCSMGGLPMLNTIRHKTMYPIGAAVAICPVCDLVAMRENATFTASIDAAWGSTSEAELIANSAGYNPITEAPQLFRRIPYQFNIGSPDTIVPPADHTDLFAPMISTYAVSATVNQVGSGHLQTPHYDPALIIPFLQQYLG